MKKLRTVFIKPGRRLAVHVCVLLALIGVYVYSVSTEGFSWPYFWGAAGLIAVIGIVLNLNIQLKKATGVIFWLLLPPAGFYLLEAYSHNGFDMGGALQLLNIAFFYIFFLILFLLTGKASHSGMIGCLVTMTVGIINYYTVCFRGSPVLPWDMMSVGTALSVSGNYEFAVEYAMLMPSLGFAGLAAVASKLDVQLPKLSFHRAKWKRLAALLSVRLAGIALCLLAFAGIFTGLKVPGIKSALGLDETLFLPNSLYATNGFAVSFIYNFQYITVDKPDGYSTEYLADIMEPYMDERTNDANALKNDASDDGLVQIEGSDRKKVGAGNTDDGKAPGDAADDSGTPGGSDADDDAKVPEDRDEAGDSGAPGGSDANDDAKVPEDRDEAGDTGTSGDRDETDGSILPADDGETGGSILPADAGETAGADTSDEQMPHLIVIMNEAFSDLSVLGDFETNTDYMPFFRSLSENTVRGNLFVSVKGGNTANTEFEFLTGDTMSFLPQGSVAYQQYIHEEKPTLTSWLSSLGYSTSALHPFNASGWDRDEVYPDFGFETILFYPDFTHRELLRTYVSDESAYAQLIDVFEEKRSDGPVFAFEVTMQNHGGYYNDYDNFTPEIELLTECSDPKEKHYTEQYLSLVKRSDEAFEGLIDYFSKVDEKTIVVMFGDHQPTDIIAEPILEANGKLDDDSLQTQQERYIVPFVIWANYDIEEQDGLMLSANYLSSLLMDVAGLPKTGYQQYLSDLSKKLPVITANVYIDAGGNYYNSADNPYTQELEAYRALQYYHLFDSDKSLSDFYGVTPQTGE